MKKIQQESSEYRKKRSKRVNQSNRHVEFNHHTHTSLIKILVDIYFQRKAQRKKKKVGGGRTCRTQIKKKIQKSSLRNFFSNISDRNLRIPKEYFLHDAKRKQFEEKKKRSCLTIKNRKRCLCCKPFQMQSLGNIVYPMEESKHTLQLSAYVIQS